MQLHLVNSGNHIYRFAQVGQTVRIEVAHTDGFQLAFFVSFLHGTVCADIVAHGLVNQIQVNVAEAQLLEGGLDGLLSALITGILHPQLGGDKQLLTGYTTLGNGLSYGLLIHVGRGSVDEAIAAGDGIQYCLLALSRIGHLEHPEAL